MPLRLTATSSIGDVDLVSVVKVFKTEVLERIVLLTPALPVKIVESMDTIAVPVGALQSTITLITINRHFCGVRVGISAACPPVLSTRIRVCNPMLISSCHATVWLPVSIKRSVSFSCVFRAMNRSFVNNALSITAPLNPTSGDACVIR